MRLCLEQARLADTDVPVGALVVKEGKVIAAAANRRERDSAPFAHAEMLAMQQAAEKLGTRRLSGCTLYVSLEPCPMCAGALIMAGISRLVFAAFDPQYGCCGSLYALPLDARFNSSVQVTGGLLEAEARELLEQFFKQKRTVPATPSIVPANELQGKRAKLDGTGAEG